MRRGALPIAPPCLADAVQSLIMPGGSEWRGDSRRIFAELNRRDPERWRDGQRPTMTNLKATPVMVGDRLFLNVNMPTSVAAAVDAVAQRVEDSGRRHRGLLPSGNRLPIAPVRQLFDHAPTAAVKPRPGNQRGWRHGVPDSATAVPAS